MENTFILNLNLSPSDSASLEDAIRAFTFATNLNSEDSEAYTFFGLELYRRSLLAKAIKAYNVSIELKSEDSNTYIYLGDVHYDLTKIEEAIREYNKAIMLNSGSIEAHLGLCRDLTYKSQYNAAWELCNRAKELSPNSADVYVCIAHILCNQSQDRKHKEIKESLDMASNLSEVYGKAYGRLGTYLFEQGNNNEAVRVCKPDPIVTFKWMFLYYRRSMLAFPEDEEIVQESVKICSLAIQANYMKTHTYFTLAFISTRQKDYPKAVDNSQT